MDNISEMNQKIERRERWIVKLNKQYAELNVELESLKEQFANVANERDSLMGDVVKLKALVAELEAKLPQEKKIIIL